jgi:hypothetical protein
MRDANKRFQLTQQACALTRARRKNLNAHTMSPIATPIPVTTGMRDEPAPFFAFVRCCGGLFAPHPRRARSARMRQDATQVFFRIGFCHDHCPRVRKRSASSHARDTIFQASK